MPERVLIVGCGYRGRRLAKKLRAQGYLVRALTRSPENAAALETLGIEPRLGDVTRPETLRSLADDTVAVYHLMGSMAGSDTELRALHVDGTRNLLRALGPKLPKRYVYESSTAVYGQLDGEWLDETAPREPSSAMGRLRVEAEDLILQAHRERGLNAVVLRPASIYRPDGVINRRIREGSYTLTSDPEKLMNHVFIEDFLEVLVLALNKGRAGEAYNVADDEPKRGIDYCNHIAELQKAPKPKVDWQAPAERCAELVRASNKKVSNAKLKQDFNYKLRFPTYRDGLRESARLGWKEPAL